MLLRKFIRSSVHQIELICQVNCLWTALFLIFTINRVFGASEGAKLKSNNSYRTAYACEGKILEIKCPKDTLIHLIRANYGRYSISICNEQGNLDWKVDCTSPSSYSVIAKRCSQLSNCNISVSNYVFEDHCPGTFKYLEVQYDCMVSTYSINAPADSSVDSNKSWSNSKSIYNQMNNFTTQPTSERSLIKQQLATPPPIIVPLVKLFNNNSNSNDNKNKFKDHLITPSSLLTSTVLNVSREHIKETKEDEPKRNVHHVLSSSREPSMSSSIKATPEDSTTTYQKVSSASLKPPYLLPSNSNIFESETSEQDNITFSPPTTESWAIFDIKIKNESRSNFSLNNSVTSSLASATLTPESKGASNNNKQFKSTVISTYLNDYISNEGNIFCLQLNFRGLTWPQTKSGSQAIVQCPAPYYGSAVWECDNEGNWKGSRPDMTRCQSPWLNNLNVRLDNGDSISSIASKLALKSRQILIGSGPMLGGDIIKTVKLLQNLFGRINDNVENIQEDQRYQVVKDFAHSVIEVTGNLLDDHNHEAWLDLNIEFGPSKSDLKRQLSLKLIQIAENIATLLSATQNVSYHYHRAHQNLLFSVRDVDNMANEVSEMTLPQDDMVQRSLWKKKEDVVVLPSFTFDKISTNPEKLLKVVFLVFRNIGKFLSTNESKSHQVINSNIITLSFVKNTQHLNVHLTKPVNIYFKHTQEVNVSTPKCVFWDTNLSDWSSEGCWIISTNKSHTGCACNHLTTWALLMDLNEEKQIMNPQLSTIFAIVCASCVLSMVIILFTFILLLIFRVSNHHQTIYKNLCVVIFIAEIILCAMAFRFWIQSESLMCRVLSLIVQFIIQSIFNLILIDSILVYCCASNCDKINKYISRECVLLYLASYGIPLLTIGITFLINPNLIALSARSLCWFNSDLQDLSLLWLFLPTFLSITSTIFLILLTIFGKLSHTSPGAHLELKSNRYYDIKHCWRSIFLILSLESIHWIVAHIFVHTPLSSYKASLLLIFSFTNISQAVGLFIISFAKNDKVRNSICKTLSSVGWLPRFIKSNNIRPPLHSPPPSLTAYFYSLDPSHLISPPSPIIKLTPSSSTSSSRHRIYDHTTSRDMMARHTLSGSRYIPEVNPYAPPVPIPFHEYEDISRPSSDVNYGFQQQRHQPNSCYYHTTRSPIYYTERKPTMNFGLDQ